MIDALKKGYWWREELKKDLSKPPGEGQADARTGFAGAIPVNKDGTANCEGVGATCEADKVKADEAAEKKAEEKEDKDPVAAEFHKIKGDVDEKKKKVEEKGEQVEESAPKEEAPKAEPVPEPKKEAKAAFAQHKTKHHKRHHHHHKRY